MCVIDTSIVNNDIVLCANETESFVVYNTIHDCSLGCKYRVFGFANSGHSFICYNAGYASHRCRTTVEKETLLRKLGC